MSFTNLYYKRTAGTSRPCYVCFKPTPTVLATVNTVDFLYCCDAHLTDRGFATLVTPEPEAKPAASAEEIAKVKAEWEEKERKKKEKAKEKDKEKIKEGEKEKEDTIAKSPSPAITPSASPSPTSTHQKYTLHRDIFSLRQAEHRRRRQAAQAKELAPRLPGAPKGALSSPPPPTAS